MRFKPFTVALIGPDGAGKSSVSEMLVRAFALPIKQLYMGVNLEASQQALLTSRLRERLRRYSSEPTESAPAREKPFIGRQTVLGGVGKGIWATGRLLNQLADEWYRQLLSWSYECRGHIVLYDRHYLFDFSLDGVEGGGEPLERRVHRWMLTHLYPQPDLVIYLDAPGELLFARKREKTPEELERRRQSYLVQSRSFSRFVVVDATQPIEKVFSDVSGIVLAFWQTRQRIGFSERPLRQTVPQ